MITDSKLLELLTAKWIDADDPEFKDRIDALLNLSVDKNNKKNTLRLIRGGK